MRYRLRGSIAAGQQCRLLRRFQNVGFAGLQFTVLAGIGIIHVLADPELRGLHLQCTVDLFADLLHSAAAGRADKFFAAQAVFHHLGGRPFRNDIQDIAGLPLARMGFHGDLFRGSGLGAKCVGFQFIEA